MAQQTGIEWTDVTWNPTFGCSKVSTGCRECYAETIALKFGLSPAPWTERNAAQNVVTKPKKLREPLSRAKAWRGIGAAAAAAGMTDGKLVFVNSMSDLFHEEVPDDYIARVFAVMAAAPQHTFQVLTKRPERMRAWFAWEGKGINRCGTVRNVFDFAGYAEKLGDPMARLFEWPLPNVWLGVSIENRKWVARADVLRDTPAAVRFISAEPLLGPLVAYLRSAAWPCMWWDRGELVATEEEDYGLDLSGIDWLIVGGESGKGHRPMDPQWARDLRDACIERGWRCECGDLCERHEAFCYRCGAGQPEGEPGEAGRLGTAFFMKQLGGGRPGTALDDLPEDLRIREFPAVAR